MIHFISDLHLSAQASDATRIFLDYLEHEALSADQLFILGDLFEAWPGDDYLDDPEAACERAVADGLRSLAGRGVQVSVMHGNRDFLLGTLFEKRSGVRLVPDPFVLSADGWQFVLSHGDILCTNDAEYVAFRAQVRDPAWRAAFLSKPLAERKAIAVAMRRQSEDKKREKDACVMDVNTAETEDFLRTCGYATLIHGHTHRPATHAHLVDGIHVERWVLSDWHEHRGEVLRWDGTRLTRQALIGPT